MEPWVIPTVAAALTSLVGTLFWRLWASEARRGEQQAETHRQALEAQGQAHRVVVEQLRADMARERDRMDKLDDRLRDMEATGGEALRQLSARMERDFSTINAELKILNTNVMRLLGGGEPMAFGRPRTGGGP